MTYDASDNARKSYNPSVMACRREPPNSLDFFPTPPWGTRALMRHVLGDVSSKSVWEPAAGEGHMAEVLRESFAKVHASDVHDYGKGYVVGSFVGVGPDVAQPPFVPDWVITNPPFNLGLEFAHRALDVAREGVALLMRTSWLESIDRYRELFAVKPPTAVAVFVERLPMVRGRWDPEASSATSYAWFVWRKGEAQTRLIWLPDGCSRLLTADDLRNFAKPEAAKDSAQLNLMEAAE